ncbi:Bgt-4827 [Blumeria graminis f. sp. tritici]|uniref:Acyltransferase n=2 Tax=Blumeria graminis f. sp. tritici TaxID=62690 RepID=A0A061HKX2_BLUGR|nr:acyltransferase [Blumeria graminis f. sp. tritici 96224]VDB86021.1 Bgt-4827 [Blumeria graminis f. sp. tritici]
MEWLGTARTSFTHSPSTIKLNGRDGTESDLSTVCRESTPPCKLNPLLFNGHLQTMWTAIGKEGPHLHYKRKIFEASDQTYAGTFAVDFLAEPSSETDETLPIRTTYFSDNEFKNMKSSGFEDDRPMLVILHGLSAAFCTMLEQLGIVDKLFRG